jgi:hypothetical protein
VTGENDLDQTSDFYCNNLHTREDFRKHEWTDEDFAKRSNDGYFVSIGKYLSKEEDEISEGEYVYVFDDMNVYDFRDQDIYKKLTPMIIKNWFMLLPNVCPNW